MLEIRQKGLKLDITSLNDKTETKKTTRKKTWAKSREKKLMGKEEYDIKRRSLRSKVNISKYTFLYIYI